MVFARLVTHYWSHGCFLEEDQILGQMDRLAGIPAVLIHGLSARRSYRPSSTGRRAGAGRSRDGAAVSSHPEPRHHQFRGGRVHAPRGATAGWWPHADVVLVGVFWLNQSVSSCATVAGASSTASCPCSGRAASVLRGSAC